jgi:hypothetical protein
MTRSMHMSSLTRSMHMSSLNIAVVYDPLYRESKAEDDSTIFCRYDLPEI